MTSGPEPIDEDAVAITFLQLYRADATAGGSKDLATYQARFPGFEAVVAREFAALQGGGGSERPQAGVDHLQLEARDREVLAPSLGSGRYRTLCEVARGGMSVVVRVRDERLRRDLAMKVLGDPGGARSGETGSDPRRLRRFVDEALITGQLAHPGIVPVHDLGLDDAGRAFFTMALIEGRNFAEVIAAVHSGEPAWTLPRALGVVLRVCEAVAFAHSRGVIHRDLKPSNVMVGAFGETYVLDWGLARVADSAVGRDVRPSAAVSTAGEDSPLRTMAGDVLGTPAYMAPEQARGEVDRVGERADVYALGAILYHLLTGTMPYGGAATPPSSRDVLESARRGPPPSITTLRREVAPELVAICDRAMQRDPADRYPSVGQLADDLRAFLELRVVKAHATGAFAELRKWVRRNRALAATAAAAVLALVAGLVFSLHQKSQAETQAAMAEANYRLAREAVDRMLTRVGMHRLAAVPQMEAVRRDLLHQALAMHRDMLARRRKDVQAEAAVGHSLLNVAQIQRALGDYGGARRAAEEAIAMFALVRAQAGDDLGPRRGSVQAYVELSAALLEQGDLDACAAACGRGLQQVDAVLRANPTDDDILGCQAALLNNLANTHTGRDDWAGALEIRRQVAAIAGRLAAARPADLEAAHFAMHAAMNLGLTLANLDQLPEAEEWLGVAMQRATPLSPEHERDPLRRLGAAAVLNRLAWVQFRRARVADARTSLETAIALLRALVADFPQTPKHHSELGTSANNLANVLRKVGDSVAEELALEEAAREHAAALRLAPEDADSAQYVEQTRLGLCDFLLREGRHADAARRIAEFAATDLAALPPLAAARLELRCASVAAADGALAEGERATLAEQCTRSAVQRLRAAASADATVLDGEEFASLRSRADFAALRREARRD